MELWNIKSEEFQKNGIQLIQELGEIVVKVRYPYQAGNKDFFIIKTQKEFNEFLDNRKSKDSVTIYKFVEKIKEGVISKEFIKSTLIQLGKPKYTDWLVIFPEITNLYGNWFYDETKEELEESLKMNLGQYVTIFEDPDWLKEEMIYHGYTPDEDGKIRPGAY